MEINDHFYSTAHFFPKQLKNSCKSRSGELKNSSGKFFWGRIFQSGSKTRLWLHAPSTWWSICSALSSSESTTRHSSFPLRWNSWSDLWGKQLWRWQAVTRLTQAKTKWRSSRCRTHGWMSQHHWPEQTVLNDCVFFATAWQLEAVVLSRESKEPNRAFLTWEQQDKLSVNHWNYFQITYLGPGRPAGGHGTRRPRGLHHLSLSGCPLDWMPSCYWSPRRGQSSTRTRDHYRY